SYNSTPVESINYLPFYVNYRFKPDLHQPPIKGENTSKAIIIADKLKELY
ncbi:hypothetical protein M431DRAFT_102456, partial [Trichoderma harzianum CBS 226.95]